MTTVTMAYDIRTITDIYRSWATVDSWSRRVDICVLWSPCHCLGHQRKAENNEWRCLQMVESAAPVMSASRTVINVCQLHLPTKTIFTINGSQQCYEFHWLCMLVAWYSGRTLVFYQRTFPVLWLWVTIYVGKPSAVGHPTMPTQPFILPE